MKEKTFKLLTFSSLAITVISSAFLIHRIRYAFWGIKIIPIRNILNDKEILFINCCLDFILSLPLSMLVSYFLLLKIDSLIPETCQDFLKRFQRHTPYGVVKRNDPELFKIAGSKSPARGVLEISAGLIVLAVFIACEAFAYYARYEILGIPFISAGAGVQPAINSLINFIISIPFLGVVAFLLIKLIKLFEKILGESIIDFYSTILR